MTINTLPPSPNGEITHGEVREKINEVIDSENLSITNNPASRETLTATDSGTYNLVSGNPTQSVGLIQSITIIDPTKETYDFTTSLPFVRGAQNNSAVEFELYLDFGGANEQLLISGQYLISNDEASVQADSNVPKGTITAPAGTYDVEMRVGAAPNQGNIDCINGHNGLSAVFRTKIYRDTY